MTDTSLREEWSRAFDQVDDLVECMKWVRDRVTDGSFDGCLVDHKFYYMTGHLNSRDILLEKIAGMKTYGLRRDAVYMVFRSNDEELMMQFKLTWK